MSYTFEFDESNYNLREQKDLKAFSSTFFFFSSPQLGYSMRGVGCRGTQILKNLKNLGFEGNVEDF